MKKRLFKLGLIVLSLSLILSGCSSVKTTGTSQTVSVTANASSQATSQSTTTTAKKDFVIGLSNGYFGNTWRTQFVDDITLVANEYKTSGAIKDFIVNNAGSDAEQIAAVNNFIAQKVDAIIVVPRVESALTPIIAKATAQGIKVISIDDSSWPDTINVVNDNTTNMATLTEWLAEQIGGKGDIVYIDGVPGENWDNLRNTQVATVLKNYPDIKLLATAPGMWADAEASKAMTTLLNTYKNLDGVLAQDVMGRGLIQAFKTAQIDPPPICGDFVYGYFRLWDTMPKLNAITYTFPPGIGADALRIAVNLLNGRTLKADSFSQNCFNPDLKNSIVMPLPYYVVRDVPTDNPKWMQDLDPRTKVISLKEALAMGEGKDDNEAIDYMASQADIDKLFE